jgi:hypothetical protein
MTPGGERTLAERQMEEARSRGHRDQDDAPDMARLLDPVAWERRVKEARARRAEALARRGGRESAGLSLLQRGPRQHGPRSPRPGGPSAPASETETRARPVAVAVAFGPVGREPEAPVPPRGEARDRGLVPEPGDAEQRVGEPAQPGSAAVSVITPHASDLQTEREAARSGAGVAPSADADMMDRPLEGVIGAQPPDTDSPSAADRRPAPVTGEAMAALPVAVPAPTPLPAQRVGAPHAIPSRRQNAQAAQSAVTASSGDLLTGIVPVSGGRQSAHAKTVPATIGKPSGWTRSRIAAVFAAGIAIGLGGALVVREPALDRLAGGNPGSVQSAADAPAPAPVETARSETSEAAGGGAPPIAEPDLAAATEGWELPDLTVARLQLPQASAPPQEPASGHPATPLSQPAQDVLPEIPAPAEALATPDAEAPTLPGPPAATNRPPAPGAAESRVLPGGPDVLTPPQTDERPAARPPLPGMDTAATTAVGMGADEAAADTGDAEESAPAAQQVASPRRILVHAPSGLTPGEAEGAIAAVDAAGFVAATRVPVQLTIGSTNVRYYHPEDAAAAEAIAASIAEQTGSPALARDFTEFRPQPLAGTIEVWLAGQPGGSAPVAQAPRQPAPTPPAAQRTAPPQAAAQNRQPPRQASQQRRPAPATPQEAAMRELENLADEIARAISRSLRN